MMLLQTRMHILSPYLEHTVVKLLGAVHAVNVVESQTIAVRLGRCLVVTELLQLIGLLQPAFLILISH